MDFDAMLCHDFGLMNKYYFKTQRLHSWKLFPFWQWREKQQLRIVTTIAQEFNKMFRKTMRNMNALAPDKNAILARNFSSARYQYETSTATYYSRWLHFIARNFYTAKFHFKSLKEFEKQNVEFKGWRGKFKATLPISYIAQIINMLIFNYFEPLILI